MRVKTKEKMIEYRLGLSIESITVLCLEKKEKIDPLFLPLYFTHNVALASTCMTFIESRESREFPYLTKTVR